MSFNPTCLADNEKYVRIAEAGWRACRNAVHLATMHDYWGTFGDELDDYAKPARPRVDPSGEEIRPWPSKLRQAVAAIAERKPCCADLKCPQERARAMHFCQEPAPKRFRIEWHERHERWFDSVSEAVEFGIEVEKRAVSTPALAIR